MLIKNKNKFLVFLSIILFAFLAFLIFNRFTKGEYSSGISCCGIGYEDNKRDGEDEEGDEAGGEPVEETEEEKKEEEEKKQEDEEEKPKVAIIIDDLGNSFEKDSDISSIEEKLTLAVLPERASTVQVANYFSGFERFELLLHLPLEPIGVEDVEEEMLMTDMNEEEIRSALKNYLGQLEGRVAGVNNHKGSKYTSDGEKMKVLFKILKEEGLFFVDSFTYKDSVALEVANEVGVEVARRDVFLDNVDDKEKIKEKLEEAVEIAHGGGSAIAIGHSRPNTINVLEEEMTRLEKEGVEFVKVSELLD